MAGTIRTGMAGWIFPEWRGGQFYPEGLKQKDELAWASRHVTAIEINSTFYQLQKPESLAGWAAETPPAFRFTVKGHQKVTHIKRLKEVDETVTAFFKSINALGDRLAAVCWQLPPNFKYDLPRIEAFLKLLPKGIRQALEVRNAAFATVEFIDLLRAHNVALVTADTADWPWRDQTADFTYCRLQGAPGSDRYTPADLDAWAADFAALSQGRPIAGRFIAPMTGAQLGRDVFAYFVSTDKPNAPRNALGIQERLGLSPAG